MKSWQSTAVQRLNFVKATKPKNISTVLSHDCNDIYEYTDKVYLKFSKILYDLQSGVNATILEKTDTVI